MLSDTDLKILDQYGFSNYSAKFVREALPTVELQFLHDVNPQSVTESRFGGKGVLPRDVEWPIIEEKPLDFIALLNLSQLGCEVTGFDLPDSGFLIFFCDFLGYRRISSHLRSHIIFTTHDQTLDYRDHPIKEPNPKFYMGTPSRVQAKRFVSFPDPATLFVTNGWDINTDREKVEEYYNEIGVDSPRNFELFARAENSSLGQLGGFPQYCQLNAADFPEFMVNPRLIFQFQDGANGNWFIFCSESELLNRRFRNCCLYHDFT